MTAQELFTKNLKLSTEFDLYLLEHPDVLVLPQLSRFWLYIYF